MKLHMSGVIYSNCYIMLYKCYVNAKLYSSLTIGYQTIFICKIAYLTLIFFATLSHSQKFRIFKGKIRICVGSAWGGVATDV